jgi:hypothetical protein
MTERRRRRAIAARDQSASAFSVILANLCGSTGALAAALVDAEGETVDYAGHLEPYDIRVAAAEWRIVLSVVQQARLPGFRQITSLSVRAAERSFFIESMPDGYAIAMRLPRRGFLVSRRALSQAVRELGHEAGIDLRQGRAAAQWDWARVRVRTTASRRPDALWLGDRWSPLVILGRFQARDLLRNELGYRARLESGAEVFLVREPLGRWFVDNPGALVPLTGSSESVKSESIK